MKLFDYAYCGDFVKKIEYLSQIAEKENWYNDTPELSEEKRKYAVLWQYVHYTFEKHVRDNKIVNLDDHSIINTGLMTQNGEDIFMLFTKNRNSKYKTNFYLKSFYSRSSRELPIGIKPILPEPINYFENCRELMYFDTNLAIIPDFDHIYNDNFVRLPEQLQTLDRESALNILNGALNKAIKKAKRNNRLVVPQLFHDNIQYLIPLIVLEKTVPLVLEPQQNEYRANTILTLGMAYNNARLIMKPESSWLLQ